MYELTELEEITDGMTLEQLKAELKSQINNGELIGGTICSHFVHLIQIQNDNNKL